MMLGIGTAQSDPIGAMTAAYAGQTPNDYSSWFCTHMPFADFFSGCQVPTLQQIEAEHQQELSKVAQVNPELAAQGFATGQQLTAADCAENPEACAEFTFAGQNPTAAAILGAGPAGRTIYETGSSILSNPTPWILLAAVGLLLLTRK